MVRILVSFSPLSSSTALAFRRSKRGNYLPEDDPSFASLATLVDNSLFQPIVSNPDHILRHLCQERPASQYNLRPRRHPFVLLNSDPKNYLPQLLYKDIN